MAGGKRRERKGRRTARRNGRRDLGTGGRTRSCRGLRGLRTRRHRLKSLRRARRSLRTSPPPWPRRSQEGQEEAEPPWLPVGPVGMGEEGRLGWPLLLGITLGRKRKNGTVCASEKRNRVPAGAADRIVSRASAGFRTIRCPSPKPAQGFLHPPGDQIAIWSRFERYCIVCFEYRLQEWEVFEDRVNLESD